MDKSSGEMNQVFFNVQSIPKTNSVLTRHAILILRSAIESKERRGRTK